ncbi:MAG: hypothetical protein IPF53_05120 [Blastocatellia bacterium]|nr:hypothetical protein [Blastocatellia bacterium]
MEYADITSIFVRIEQPLSDLANGSTRQLIKRDLNDLNEAWNQLGVLLKTEAERDAATPSLLSLGGLPRYLDGVTTAQVRSLRAAGISSLNDLADAPVEDIMAVAGLPKATAERIRAFSAGSVSVAAAESRRNASTKLPEGWMRLDIESDLFRGRLTFEYSTIAKYLEPILAKLAENDVKAPKPARKSKALATPSRTPAKRAAKKRTT